MKLTYPQILMIVMFKNRKFNLYSMLSIAILGFCLTMPGSFFPTLAVITSASSSQVSILARAYGITVLRPGSLN